MTIKPEGFYPKCLLNKRSPDIVIFTGLVYLIYSIDDKGAINSDFLQKARNYIQKITLAAGVLFMGLSVSFAQFEGEIKFKNPFREKWTFYLTIYRVFTRIYTLK